MRYVKMTIKGGTNIRLVVTDDPPADYSVISMSDTQNGVRRQIGIICRMDTLSTGQRLTSLYDFAVTHKGGVYKLWTYTRNFSGRACYYAGMIHAYNTLRPQRKAKARSV